MVDLSAEQTKTGETNQPLEKYVAAKPVANRRSAAASRYAIRAGAKNFNEKAAEVFAEETQRQTGSFFAFLCANLRFLCV